MTFEEYQQRVREWLVERAPGFGACPFCSTSNWTIAALGEVPLRTAELGEDFDAKAIPVVPLICSQCGHSVLFNALVMGLVEPLEHGSEVPR
jgi:hypothetical protein